MDKPNPVYPGAAKKAGIYQGTVQLRVTFEATGKIGNISPVNERNDMETMTKYGFVKEAIKAAKQIKFEPQTRNDIPVNTTRIFTFSFNIY